MGNDPRHVHPIIRGRNVIFAYIEIKTYGFGDILKSSMFVLCNCCSSICLKIDYHSLTS